VVYKGDGFYVTDYKDSDRKEKRAQEKKQANGGATSCCAANGACSTS
jgi:predicted nucleic acid-binding Zn ribbon protein